MSSFVASFWPRTFALACCCHAVLAAVSWGQVIPGTGVLIGGDDFEDDAWSYTYNNPKNSGDLESGGQNRPPVGRSANGLWYEGNGRGQPDLVRRVETPPDGLEGSAGALLIASQFTGNPGRPTAKSEQDDLYMKAAKGGGSISVSRTPNMVVRVWVPPFEEWERRNGSSFAVRATLRGAKPGTRETEPYWPGLFFQFHPMSRNAKTPEYASLLVRAGERGQDYIVRRITDPGWYTVGMSFTPDGRVHYFAREGTDNLTAEDHLASHYCYGFRAQKMVDVFFDVFAKSNGRDWSTGWVIDDPEVYVASEQNHLSRQPRSGRSR